MAVYTQLNPDHIRGISGSCGIDFDPGQLESIESGSTDSCYYLRDTAGRTYFLKVHEDAGVSPHGLNVDQRYMVEFADYVSSFNDRFKELEMLRPYKWKDGNVYGLLKPSNGSNCKVLSVWPYIPPDHPASVAEDGSYSLDMISRFGKATAELHNVSSKYTPSEVHAFPRGIADTQDVMHKIAALPEGLKSVAAYLGAYANRFTETPEVFIETIADCVKRYAAEWVGVSKQLAAGYIHGELKPSNTLMGRNGKIIFIDMCKSGLAPLSLEVGMASQHFTNPETVYIPGIERFVESYLSLRDGYVKEELRYIPLMIKISAIRLAVYRTYAVASGFRKQKLISTPLEVCLTLDRIETDLVAALLS